jgi:hypothetical protein
MAPAGDQALAQVGSDLYSVTVPMVGGEAPEVSVTNPRNAQFPMRKLKEVGVQFPAWSGDGRKVHWSIGNAHFVYDLDRAQAYDVSVAADRRARGLSADTARGDSAQARGERGDTTPAQSGFRPAETRIRITAERLPRSSAVRGGRAITMRGNEVIENADIVVRANRIVAVGPRGQVTVPTDARVLDITGKTVLPGFVDTHAHLRARGVHREQNWSYVANLAYGVTTTRDPQTGTTDVLAHEDRVTTGAVLGPRIYSTGPGVFSSENIQNVAHARRVLRR